MSNSSDFSGALVIGDQNKNVFFLNTDGVSQVKKAALQNGNMASSPVGIGELAVIGENLTNLSSNVHAYNGQTGERKWSLNSLQGHIEALPAVSSDYILYIATSSGILYAIDIGSAENAGILWDMDVLNLPTGIQKKVAACLLSNDEKQIFLVTEAGVYGIKLNEKNTKGEVIWCAEEDKSFIQAVPILNNKTIFAACGNLIYAFDTSYKVMDKKLVSQWSYIANGKVCNLINLDCMHLFSGDESGFFHTLDMETGNRVSELVNPGLTKDEICQSVLGNGDIMVSLSSGEIKATRIYLTSGFGTLCDRVWQKSISGSTFSGIPTVVNETVFAVDNNGELHAFNLSDGTQLWTKKLGAEITAPFSNPMFTPFVDRNNGAVRFLLDGRNYFSTMKNLLIAAKNGDLNNGTSQVDNPTFENLVTAVGEAGRKVYVLMWKPSMLSNILMADANVNARTESILKGKANVNVYLEPYTEYQADLVSLRDWVAADIGALSQHQKIAIFCINGTKLALVSGMNISDSDWDKEAHPMDEKNIEQKNTYSGRHDTGILLQGSIIDAVEKEFDRRWSKSGNSCSDPGTTYVKIGTWAIQHDMSLDGSSPTPYSNPAITEPQISVKVLTTNFDDSSHPVRLIRDSIIQEINSAQDYIYLENFTMHDVGITQALASKLKDKTNSCKVVILLPHPPVGEHVQGKYIKYAMTILQIASGAWTEFSFYAPTFGHMFSELRKLRKSEVTEINIEYGKVCMNTMINYKLKGDSYQYSIPVYSITSLTIEDISSESRLIYCSPARYFTEVQPGNENNKLKGWAENFRGIYIHSKLALFDDKRALLGSANFNSRSMKYDGEMSVLIENSVNATNIRTQLFNHWNMETISNWALKMKQFELTSTSGIGILPLKYEALIDFEPRKKERIPRDFLEYVVNVEDFM